jgi:hypothetical protein
MGYSNVFRAIGFKLHAPDGKANAPVRPRPVVAVRQPSGGGNASYDIAIGDAYAIDVNGNAFRAGPNDAVRGVVIGFRFIAVSTIMNSNGPVSEDYSANGSVDTILGVEDDITLFEVQSDNFTAPMAGMKVNLVDAAPDSTLSQSRQSLTTAAQGTQFQIQDLVPSLADNAYGTNARVFCRLLQTFED